ncbi:MAG: DUF695 domain-containing protein [Pseudomonadota bacterium]|nr:DUF695 domain-containing protein [Pseudomonadota bacterium]
MKYQLVIQFSEESYGDLDWIINIEDRLDECLVDAEVDGHDIGNGEVNIFIHTNNPEDTFEAVKNLLQNDYSAFNDAKIAYGDLGGDRYTCLWPKELTEFKVI